MPTRNPAFPATPVVIKILVTEMLEETCWDAAFFPLVAITANWSKSSSGLAARISGAPSTVSKPSGYADALRNYCRLPRHHRPEHSDHREVAVGIGIHPAVAGPGRETVPFGVSISSAS